MGKPVTRRTRTKTMTLIHPGPEYLAYLNGIVSLKLWFLWHWLRAHPAEDCRTALRERVDIYRKTDINAKGINPVSVKWDDPRWVAMERAVSELYRTHAADDSADRFEAEAFAVFAPSLAARALRTSDCAGLGPYTYGSVRFDPPQDKLPQRVFIHIANTVAPRSIFEDAEHLPRCLFEVMRRAEAAHGATELGTSTWLNAHPEWLRLFPVDWLEHAEPPNEDIRWHYGYWGQFINARGTLNDRLVRQFRATACFPYLPRYAWCSFISLRRHLGALGMG
jgi:hypothetical protein